MQQYIFSTLHIRKNRFAHTQRSARTTHRYNYLNFRHRRFVVIVIMFIINFQCVSDGNDITRTKNQLGAINLHCFKCIIRNVFWEMRISNFSEEREILTSFYLF